MVKKISRRLLRFLVAVCIITIFASVFVSGKSVLVFSVPPASSDWVVTGTESYYDRVIVLNGNLIIEAGGNLTFRKVTLRMNCTYDGQFNITVEHGGRFYVLNGSIITSVDPDNEYAFVVCDGSTFRMNHSKLHECGWAWPEYEKTAGLSIRSGDAIVENSLISHNWNGINVLNDGVVVCDNNVTANNNDGIVVCWCNSTIYNNYLSWNNDNGMEILTCNGSIIYNNTVTSNLQGGIKINNANPIIRDNIITFNDGDGIYFWDEANPIIQDNTITSNTASGIAGQENCSAIMQGNNITSNNAAGIKFTNNRQGIIQGNVIMNNSINGISFEHVPDMLIQGNIVTSNGGFGVHCGAICQSEVHWNDIYDNSDNNLINDDPSVTVNATYNYWGDGPEKISGNILYDPWLTESIIPLAEITSPLPSETVSSTVPVSTEVNAPNGDHKVEFCIDDQPKYTDYDAPYEWNWNTTQYTETEHKITAKAHDKFGLETSTSITVFVDNTAPTVSIKEPASESTYCAVISVSVNATDNQEIGNVHVKVDNTEWLVMTYDPADLLWKYDFNTTLLSDGEHTLMTLALDKASNPATTSVTLFTDNAPPTLTIQTPQSGITVGLTLIFDVQASDAIGISRIEFYIQDVLVCTISDTPYQWSWDTTQYPNGEYTITVKAYDTVGNTQTKETTVTVKNVESPWWQTNLWTIIQVLVAIGGLILALLAYLTKKKEEKKKKRKK